ncbi:helix-hairpin-helix domain-containing protein [Clostridium kluyveri]|uniref:DNA-binding protein n=1 Tax=Clostridium kluyveri TaxID=1534 RepID=A0A1L5F5I9_CLOKL|nr:helix-hairpin-helix domain-containing protein [Clostridium kluyveri]APM38269.1 DNA-binding protein [Clostridium kluyveri]
MKYKKKIIGSVVILIILSSFLIVFYINSKSIDDVSNNKEEIFKEQSAAGNTTEQSSSDITVYINGEVKNPGVYKLKQDSRVQDLVKACGGFTNEANSYKLNLAKKLKDEDYIYVDKKSDNENLQLQNGLQGETSENAKVNINTATKEELKTIPGIGDVTAQKIIDYREQNGGFSSIEDLKNIDRIGDKTLEKIKDKVDIR